MNNTDLVNPEFMSNEDGMHNLFAWLRQNDPVSWTEPEDYRPFWSITKYQDVKFVSGKNDLFISAPRTVLMPIDREQMLLETFGTSNGTSTLVNMDSPKHPKLRRITHEWFMPENVNLLKSKIQSIADLYVDELLEKGGECDFFQEVAMYYPLRVIMSILGIPLEDEKFMLQLTQELFGNDDVTLARESDDVNGGLEQVLLDFFGYFSELIARKQREPSDDLATVIANAEVDGGPIDMVDAINYFIISATAGHDTTSATTAAGIKLFSQNPEQLDLLNEQPEHLSTAVQEVTRLAAPVRHFVRTSVQDQQVGGKDIKEGDSLALWYPSASRDEDKFDNPNQFDITRSPSPHMSFGYGRHGCLGRHLAALELSTFYQTLLPKVKSIEPTGTPEYTQSTFVSGLKSLPVNFHFK